MGKIFISFGCIVFSVTLLFSCASSERVREVDTIPELPEKEKSKPLVTDTAEIEETREKEPEPISGPEEIEITMDSVSPLTPWAIYSFVFNNADAGWSPVHINGVPVLLFHDIDENGFNDVFALYIDRDDPQEAEFDRISDFSRLYDIDSKPFSAELRLFFQRDGMLQEGYTIDLGKKMVIDEISKFLISETIKTPFSLYIDFQNPEGTERTWIFSQKQTYEKLTLRETFGAFIDVKDINNDGVLDILHFEKSFEAGMGYETYITWYNWDTTTYSQYAVTNVVRHLHDYLEKTKQLLIEEDWTQLLQFGLPKQQLNLLMKKQVLETDIIQSLFIPSISDNANDNPELIDLSIENIIFPEIVENPFQKDLTGHYVFPLRVRVIAENGEYLYIARIGMKENPFQSQQFYFILMNENVYN